MFFVASNPIFPDLFDAAAGVLTCLCVQRRKVVSESSQATRWRWKFFPCARHYLRLIFAVVVGITHSRSSSICTHSVAAFCPLCCHHCLGLWLLLSSSELAYSLTTPDLLSSSRYHRTSLNYLSGVSISFFSIFKIHLLLCPRASEYVCAMYTNTCLWCGKLALTTAGNFLVNILTHTASEAHGRRRGNHLKCVENLKEIWEKMIKKNNKFSSYGDTLHLLRRWLCSRVQPHTHTAHTNAEAQYSHTTQ